MPPQKIKAGYIDANGSANNQTLFSNGSFVYWANTTQNLSVYYANDAIAFSGLATGNPSVTNAAGSNTQVQFNSSGVFAGSAGLTFDTSTNSLSIATHTVVDTNGIRTRTGGGNYGVRIFPGGGSDSNTSILQFTDASQTVQIGTFQVNTQVMSIGTDVAVPLIVRYGGVNVAIANTLGVHPAASNTHDLGTSSLRWRNIYTNDLNLSNGIGDYTVVEGEEDLFLYNNKSGKVFKFALIEVDPKEAPPKVGNGN